MELEDIYKELIMRQTPFSNDSSLVLKLQLSFRAITENIIENEDYSSEQKVDEMKALLSAHMEVMEMYAAEAGRQRMVAQNLILKVKN